MGFMHNVRSLMRKDQMRPQFWAGCGAVSVTAIVLALNVIDHPAAAQNAGNGFPGGQQAGFGIPAGMPEMARPPAHQAASQAGGMGSISALLTEPDQSYLEVMEQWEQRIRLLQYALKYSELEVRRAQQEKQLNQLRKENADFEFLASGGFGDEEADLPGKRVNDIKREPAAEEIQGLRADLDEMMGKPAANGIVKDAGAEEAETVAAPPPAPPRIQVHTVRGVEGELTATMVADGGFVLSVQEGDEVGNGHRVTRISHAGVTVRAAETGKVHNFAVVRRDAGAGSPVDLAPFMAGAGRLPSFPGRN